MNGPRPPLLGVVLAGGRSSRMGRDKAALGHPSGQSFLQHAVALLQPLCTDVVVSVGGLPVGGLPVGVAMLDDPVPGRGPAMGVATAVAAAARRGQAGALVIPVDMPALTADHLAALIEAHRGAADQIVTATFDGGSHHEPLLAIYPIRFADALQQLATSQDRGLNRWLVAHPVRRVALPATAAANLNTPAELADYQRFRATQ